MDKYIYDDIETYVINQITDYDSRLKYRGYAIEPITEYLPERKRISFGRDNNILLQVSVASNGFINISFSNNDQGSTIFFFRMYLAKYDKDAYEEFNKCDELIRKQEEFSSRVNTQLEFFLRYLKQSQDLQAVLNEEKWFNIPIDFGGMK